MPYHGEACAGGGHRDGTQTLRDYYAEFIARAAQHTEERGDLDAITRDWTDAVWFMLPGLTMKLSFWSALP